jgi:hypothetical protein
MTRRTLTTTLVLVMLAMIELGAGIAAAGEDKNAVDEKAAALEKMELPSKDSAEYWVIRTQTMTEFIPFMTQKRAEFRKTSKLMMDFLLKIGKAADFHDSGVKAPDDHKLYLEFVGLADRAAQANVHLQEKRPSWEETVECAMKMIMVEGYLPTDVADEEELQTIKRLCAQKEKYGQKVRDELHGLVQECLDAWFYLDTIGKQGAFKEYKYLQEENERKEKEEALEERKEQVRERASRIDRLKEMRRYDARYRRNRINFLNYGYGRYRW